MKTVTPALATLLQTTTVIWRVELYTLTRAGTVLARWCNADIAVTDGTTTWTPGPLLTRGDVTTEIGLAVATCSVSMLCDLSITLGGVPLVQAARRGALDGVEILIERGLTSDPFTPLPGRVHVFEGRVADVEMLSNGLRITARAHTELLDSPFPTAVYQDGCVRQVYDAGCGLSKAANGANFTVQAGSTASTLLCAVTGTGTYDLGDLVFTSGVNAGVRRSVKAHTAGQLALSFALIDPPAVGDTFTVYKGCDRTRGTCNGRFGNLPRFKGFPLIPVPEAAL